MRGTRRLPIAGRRRSTGRRALVVGAAQPKRLAGRAGLDMKRAGEVIEVGDLPAARLLDAACRPVKREVGPVEFHHRLGDALELVRSGQIAAQKPHEPVDVTVEDGQPLVRVSSGEGTRAGALGDGLAVRPQAVLAQRICVAHRVDLEEVLILKPEADHPPRELGRIGDPGIARLGMDAQQFVRDVADQSRGIVGLQDHLDDMADRSLHELDQLTRRGIRGHLVQLGDDRPRGMRPGHALAVVEEATGAKPLVDRGAQSSKVPVGACRDESHDALDVVVALDCRADHFDQLRLVQPEDDLLDRRLGRAATLRG